MLLFALTLSCVAQFPLDVVPPIGMAPYQVVVNGGPSPTLLGAPAVEWIGGEYLLGWRDTRRQSPVASERSSLFITTIPNGGGLPTVPGGREVPNSLGVQGLGPHLVSTKTFSWLVATVSTPDGGSRLYGWRGGVGQWDGGWDPRLQVSTGDVTAGKTAAGANDTDAVAVWASPSGIDGYRYPAGTRFTIAIDAGVTQLSAGGIDGGFLVSWLEGNLKAQVARVTATTVESTSLLTTNATSTRALTNPSHELVVTQGAEILVNRNTPPWLGLAFETPTGPASFATSTRSTLFITYQGATWLSRFASPADLSDTSAEVALPSGATALATGGRSDLDGTLIVSRLGRDLRTQEVDITRGTNSRLAAGALTLLTTTTVNAPASQRSPSVIWFDPLDRFLLGWEQEQPDGGSVVMVSGLVPGQPAGPAQVVASSAVGPMNPELLRAPGGGRFGLAASAMGGRVVSSLNLAAATISKGAALTNVRALPNATLGDQLALQWSSGGLTASADFDVLNKLATNDIAPRCVAAANGKLWLVTSAESVFTINDAPGGITATLSNQGLRLDAPCAVAENASSIFVASGSDGGVVRFGSFTPAIDQVSMVARGSFGSGTEALVVPPVVAAMDGGVLAAWVWAGTVGARVAWVENATNALGPGLGSDDLSSLSIASNPAGQAVVAWEAFDPRLGVRRVEFRYLLPPASGDGGTGVFDAGVVLDAGVFDAGVVLDAGVLDAGVVIDAGVLDAGVVTDAGRLDAGLITDAGTPADGGADGGRIDDGGLGTDAGPDAMPLVTFVPVCGCGATTTDALPFLLLAALMVLRRRVRD